MSSLRDNKAYSTLFYHPEVLKQAGHGSKRAWGSHLDHDEFPLPGPPVWPLLTEAQADVERRKAGSLATLVGYHPWATHTHTHVQGPKTEGKQTERLQSSASTSANY